MNFEDEKDYIMRMIKEMIRVLMSVALGKKYTSVEMEQISKYEVSGMKLNQLFDLIDQGEIDKAENLLLDGIDYENIEHLTAATLFYQYLSEKSEDFLHEHDFSKEEVLDGINILMKNSGYGDLVNILEDNNLPLQSV